MILLRMRTAIACLVVIVLVVLAFGSGMVVTEKRLFPYFHAWALWRSVRAGVLPATGDPNVIYTHFLNLRKETFDVPEMPLYGGLAILERDELHNLVVLSGGGGNPEIKIVDWKNAPVELPSNIELPDNNFSQVPDTAPDGRSINKSWIRYIDVELIQKDGILSFYVSYSHWNPTEQCFTLKVDRARIEDVNSGQPINIEKSDWKTIFASNPCLHFYAISPLQPFAGHMAGGRMAYDAAGNRLILTVGDHLDDGLVNDPPYPQDLSTSYGKVFEINVASGVSKTLSIGHRNPQGVTIDSEGRIWSVEHGPRGGDELNLIREGANYGWPNETDGTNYSGYRWMHMGDETRLSEKYEKPILSLVPGIGISNVKAVSGSMTPWDGDLLISSLSDRAIYRVRHDGTRALYAERIPVEEEIRYLEVHHGTLYVLTRARLLKLTPITNQVDQSDENIPAIWTVCVECHNGPRQPNLDRIWGRSIASQSGVDYSDALRSKNTRWDSDTLRRYLSDPEAFAPGGRMPKQALTQSDIDEIIKYVQKGAAD